MHLVCGAGGFIGGHLVAELLRRGATSVRAVDIKPLDEWFQRFEGAENVVADLRDIEACRRACAHAGLAGAGRSDNLACDLRGMGFNEPNKTACMLNVLINTHLLMAAREAGIRDYLFTSTACVYNIARQDSSEVVALKESDAYPAQPEDGYGWEKLFSERLCRHFAEDHGLRTRVVRLHNVYGPHGSWRGGREKAPAAICRKVIEAVHSGAGEIEIWGDGTQTRSFMWIDDCIDGLMHIDGAPPTEPINLGSSAMVTINQLAETAESIAGVTLRRRYKLDAPRGVAGRNSDNTLLRRHTDGWEPRTPLRTGLEATYRWIETEFAAT